FFEPGVQARKVAAIEERDVVRGRDRLWVVALAEPSDRKRSHDYGNYPRAHDNLLGGNRKHEAVGGKAYPTPRILAHSSENIVLRFFLPRVVEDMFRSAGFHQAAQVHERSVIAHAGGLLHIVRDNYHRERSLQIVDQILDSSR